MRFSEELSTAHLSLFESTGLDMRSEPDDIKDSELARAPLFSNHIARHLVSTPFSQYGLLGLQQSHHHGGFGMASTNSEGPNAIYGNHGEPWSAFICGSQGTGKSHTLANLLENCILPHDYGKLPNPLTAIAFHFDSFTSFYSTQHCELAYFCSAGIKVRVLVSPENLDTMTRLYSQLPGLPVGAPKPEVFPMRLDERQLDISNMMTLMNVREDGHTPFIDYQKFRAELEGQKFNDTQIQMLKLRLQLLDECLNTEVLGKGKTGRQEVYGDVWKFESGTLTIVDLSSEFVNAGDACALFTVCLNLFMSKRREAGRVVILDEAHKFLTETAEAQKLTENLMSIIRQQRHLGVRVMIATQEPTLDTRLLDLCNVVIVHHFSSPAWFEVLKGHLAGSRGDRERSNMIDEIFKTIVKLPTGHALVFAPRAVLHVRPSADWGDTQMARLGNGYIKMQVRKRITADGGKSITAQDVVELDDDVSSITSSIQSLADEDEVNDEAILTPPAAPTRTTTNKVAAKPKVTATLTAAAKIPTRSTVIRQTPNPTAPSDPGAPLKPPTAAEYESALRKVIPTLIKKDKENNILDHKKVRALAALQLGYKGDVIATYGRKATNDIIHDEIKKVEASWSKATR